MSIIKLGLDSQRLPAPLPIWRAQLGLEAWADMGGQIAALGGRLLSLWGREAGERSRGQPAALIACAAYGLQDGLLYLEAPLAAGQALPDLSSTFPFAGRMQRSLQDLLGLPTAGAQDSRPWLDHGLWGDGPPPLLRTAAAHETAAEVAAALPRHYPFIRVEGDGVHEVAVGPVHAGIIEPGHFRFSVVGEKVLRLEQQLGYTHKGVERRFGELAPLDAYRLAGRVSGDSTVAFGWAYCMALESAWGAVIPLRAAWLRALLLERERVANHLGDLGSLGNDAGLGFGLVQFSRLREQWQRLSKQMFGHRLLMDVIVPGGVSVDPSAPMLALISAQCEAMAREVRTLRAVYDAHAGLQDRFVGTGRVTPALAAQLGLTGLAGRASAQARDLRCDHAWPPYDALNLSMATQRSGDVAARVAIRFDELQESMRLLRALCRQLPDGPVHQVLAPPTHTTARTGLGWVEGWRGEVLVGLQLSADGRIQRCHCHDPSWQNWPVLEHAVIGNILPDFPLINKSFNLSYAGHDL
ncbi:hydrogenase large subunit [Roseateles sp. GG27B]